MSDPKTMMEMREMTPEELYTMIKDEFSQGQVANLLVYMLRSQWELERQVRGYATLLANGATSARVHRN